MRSNKLQILAFCLISLMVISVGAQAKQPEKYMQVFPFGADDFIMYVLTFMPSLDVTIRNLVVTGVLTASETHFINTTVININVTEGIESINYTLNGSTISDWSEVNGTGTGGSDNNSAHFNASLLTADDIKEGGTSPVSYTHLTLPTTPYV